MKKQSKANLKKELDQLMVQLEEIKKVYQRVDEITEAIASGQAKVDGYVAIDLFADKGKVFKTACWKRYELKRVA